MKNVEGSKIWFLKKSDNLAVQSANLAVQSAGLELTAVPFRLEYIFPSLP